MQTKFTGHSTTDSCYFVIQIQQLESVNSKSILSFYSAPETLLLVLGSCTL